MTLFSATFPEKNKSVTISGKLQHRDHHVPPNMAKSLPYFFVAGAGGRQARACPWIIYDLYDCRIYYLASFFGQALRVAKESRHFSPLAPDISELRPFCAKKPTGLFFGVREASANGADQIGVAGRGAEKSAF